MVLALHPGEVKTDMANVEIGWVVEGQMETGEAVEKCIGTIERKGRGRSGDVLDLGGEGVSVVESRWSSISSSGSALGRRSWSVRSL